MTLRFQQRKSGWLQKLHE